MNDKTRLLERLQIVEGFPVVDLSAGANTGDYVNLALYKRVVVLFASAVGASGEPPTVTFQQAQDVASTGAKALNVTTFYSKQAATDLSGTGKWTKNTQAAAGTVTITDGSKDKLWAVEFDAEELDVAGGFTCLRATIADVGSTAQLGYLLYILGDPKFSAAPEAQQSAIA